MRGSGKAPMGRPSNAVRPKKEAPSQLPTFFPQNNVKSNIHIAFLRLLQPTELQKRTTDLISFLNTPRTLYGVVTCTHVDSSHVDKQCNT